MPIAVPLLLTREGFRAPCRGLNPSTFKGLKSCRWAGAEILARPSSILLKLV